MQRSRTSLVLAVLAAAGLGYDAWVHLHLASTYDAVGEDTTFGATIDACHKLNLGALPVYADGAALERIGVSYWQDLPLTTPEPSALMSIRPAAALEAGLERRSLQSTTEDTAAWLNDVGVPESPRFGMSREREREALAALRAPS